MSRSALPYRPNVGAIVRRDDERILMCERLSPRGAWQFVQGGIDAGETHEDALWREVTEELGIVRPREVLTLVQRGPATTYDFPPGYDAPVARRYRGQLQTLFLLDFHGSDDDFNLDHHDDPEFVSVQWVERTEVVDLMWGFKSGVVRATFEALDSAFERGWRSQS